MPSSCAGGLYQLLAFAEDAIHANLTSTTDYWYQPAKEQLAQLQAAGQAQALSGQIVQTLHELAQHLSRGEPVYVYLDDATLTVAQAASRFRILRPNLEKRLDEGEIPFFRRGTDRYVYIRDMIAYSQAKRAERHRLIDSIQQASEEMGVYR